MSSSDLPSELALSRYWNAARLPEDCRTTDGRRLDLIYRGHWSRGHGPDFRGAILSLDRSPAVRGDVELHVCSSLWRGHGHASNPAYDQLVLHVVWVHDAIIPSPAPVLELSRYLSLGDLEGVPEPGGLDSSLCSVFAQAESADRAVAIIEAAGDRRFDERCVVLEGELGWASPEQVLYTALMECMGYSENKLPFRLLAEALPYEQLQHDEAARVGARLHSASGLVEGAGSLALLWREQWTLGRVRPANHPLRRMLGIAELIAGSEGKGGLVEHLAVNGVQAGPVDLLRRIQVSAPDGSPYIGAGRAVETAVNAVLPFAIALARDQHVAGLEEQALEVWKHLPRGSGSWIEREMRDHLRVPTRARLLGRARHQQGLLHL